MGKKKEKLIPVTEDSEGFIDIEEAAKFLGMSVSYVKKAQRNDDLPYYKLGASVKFLRSELHEWRKQRKVAG